MRLFAIGLNIVQFFLTLAAMTRLGMPEYDDPEYWLVVVVLIVPLVSIPSLVNGDNKSWLGLYLKRKRLEEQKRIDQLNKNP